MSGLEGYSAFLWLPSQSTPCSQRPNSTSLNDHKQPFYSQGGADQLQGAGYSARQDSLPPPPPPPTAHLIFVTTITTAGCVKNFSQV